MSAFNLGLGACPMGSSPLGFGSPGAVSSIVAPLLRKPDGTYGDAVAIGPATGDYVLDEHGNKVGGISVAQRVYLALRTRLGSSAVANLGIEPFPDVIRADFETRVRAIVQAALLDLTTAGLVELVDTNIGALNTNPDGRRIAVRWKDITNGQITTTFV